MLIFTISNNINNINLNSCWVECPTFKSKNREVVYAENRFTFVKKYQRDYSLWERIKRVLQGIWEIISSFGRGFSEKKTMDLFTKSKASIRFAVPTIDHTSDLPTINHTSDLPTIDHTSDLPLDVKGIIFKNLIAELPQLALVCKNWKDIVDDKPFRGTIRPPKAFGSLEWKEYIGVDAGEEPQLPRRAYGDMEKGNNYLTFIPEKVKKMQVDGQETGQDIALDSLEVIGNLVSNPTKGNKVDYRQDSWSEALEEKRTLEKPHWVLISKEVIGRNKYPADQQKLAKEENNKVSGTKISGLIDTTVSVFMEYVRSGERNFIYDTDKNEYNFVRVNEQTRGRLLGLGFAPSGLLVRSDYDIANAHVGFALARKSFEHLKT